MQRGLINLIVVLVIVISVFIVGGVVFWKSHDGLNMKMEKACTLEAKICPDGSSVGRSGPNCEFAACPSASPSPSADLSNWKVYTSKKYSYSVKYPSDWFVDVLDKKPEAQSDNFQIRKEYPNSDEGYAVTIKVLSSSQNLASWVANNVVDPAQNDYLQKGIDQKIDEQTKYVGDYQIISVRHAFLPAANDSIHYYFSSIGKIVDVGLSPFNDETKYPSEKVNLNILENMIGTFQFPVDTTGWKTFTSNKYGFSIMYPSDWIAEDHSNEPVSTPNFGAKPIAAIYPPNTKTVYRPFVSISAYDANAYASSKDFVQKQYKDEPFKTLTPPSSLKNLDAMEIDGLPGGGDPGPELVVRSKSGVIDFFTELHGDLGDNLANQIFSTIKFN
jgi:hypothetical protein